jgi:hypothetical protein
VSDRGRIAALAGGAVVVGVTTSDLLHRRSAHAGMAADGD